MLSLALAHSEWDEGRSQQGRVFQMCCRACACAHVDDSCRWWETIPLSSSAHHPVQMGATGRKHGQPDICPDQGSGALGAGSYQLPRVATQC